MSTDTRIDSLETQVRTLKRMLFGVFGVVVVGGLLAATSLQSVPDVVRAKRFEVVNGEGKVLVELGNIRGGGVDNGMLVTHNSAGGSLVRLSAGPGGGVVVTQNSKGQTLVELGTTTEGNGMVVTENGKGGALVELGSAGGHGLVVTENGKGQALVRLGVYTGLNGGYVETFTQTGVSTSEIP